MMDMKKLVTLFVVAALALANLTGAGALADNENGVVIEKLESDFALQNDVKNANSVFKGELPYWYLSPSHDDKTIGRWITKAPTYKTEKLSDAEDNNFPLYWKAGDSVSQWNDALGIEATYHSGGNVDIFIHGGTLEEINVLLSKRGIKPLSLESNGYTTHEKYDDATYTYNGKEITGYSLQAAHVYIIYKPRGENFTQAQYECVILHELGHAFGYIGHSSNPLDVMWYMENGRTTLGIRDINHLKQVYDKWR